MSTYKREGSPYFWYSFTVGGRRFQGSTNQTTKREADTVEKNRKREARARLASGKLDQKGKVKLDDVFGFYWLHHAQKSRSPQTISSRMRILLDGLGDATRIEDLTEQRLARYVTQRRATKTPRGNLPAAATINREVDLLRVILKKTRRTLGFAMPDIEWADLREREPEERVIEASMEEEAAIMNALRPDMRPFFQHLFITGVRLSMALGLKQADIDWEQGEVHFTGKRGLQTILPMTPVMRALYQQELQDNPTEYVFTYIAQRNSRGNSGARATVQGERYPVNFSQASSAWRRAVVKAAKDIPSVSELRLHDIRHTFGTRLYRQTQDLLIVQKALGHRDVRSTRRYTHVSQNDLQRALVNAHNHYNNNYIEETETLKVLKRRDN